MAKNELGAWWSSKVSEYLREGREEKQLIQALATQRKDPSTPSDSPAFPAPPSTHNRSSSASANYYEAVSAIADEFPLVPREREHLHYCDPIPSYPQAPSHDQSEYLRPTAPARTSLRSPEVLGKEEEAMREAIAASEREDEERSRRVSALPL